MKFVTKEFGEHRFDECRRDGAYLLYSQNGKVLLVGAGSGMFLLGGGLEADEGFVAALERELAEEAGALCSSLHPVCRTITHYSMSTNSEPFVSENWFFTADDVRFPFDAIEPDHTVIWVEKEEAACMLALEHQKWALAQYLSKLQDHIEEAKRGSLFCGALRNGDLKSLAMIPKGDRHNHAPFGGTRADMELLTKNPIPAPTMPFSAFADFTSWCDMHVSKPLKSRDGYVGRIRACLSQAREDGVALLFLNIGACAMKYFDSAPALVAVLDELVSEEGMGSCVEYELCMDRGKRSDGYVRDAISLIETRRFSSLDMTGDESLGAEMYEDVYQLARESGMILKAHIGEFSDAEECLGQADKLGVEEIQHGVGFAESEDAMRWLKDNRVRLNMCISSNIGLGVIPSVELHPLPRLFRFGIVCTIATDDICVFGNSLSEEYLLAYDSGLLSDMELNCIRVFSLEDNEKNQSVVSDQRKAT